MVCTAVVAAEAVQALFALCSDADAPAGASAPAAVDAPWWGLVASTAAVVIQLSWLLYHVAVAAAAATPWQHPAAATAPW